MSAPSYNADAVIKLLEGWYAYRLSGRKPVQPFSEGGPIECAGIPTEAAFVMGLIEYLDLESYVSKLPSHQRESVTVYWGGDGERSIKRTAKVMHKDEHAVRDWMWAGTQRVLERMTGERDLSWYIYDYRRVLKNRKDELAA